jgi:hypothetical protein
LVVVVVFLARSPAECGPMINLERESLEEEEAVEWRD